MKLHCAYKHSISKLTEWISEVLTSYLVPKDLRVHLRIQASDHVVLNTSFNILDRSVSYKQFGALANEVFIPFCVESLNI
ncbi:hypothetical protein EWB00_000225 [Schistosoma japonicum]|uniref:Uncharacterized protein n=1 Tax=Schistosoma japonicum TaxID=6182 RepID=A0A4Z2DJM2_SCHJA|nr:hypothetical protein EWB00_000225 [Schistosoma japonicum]